jgi:ribosomal protein S27AE
MNTKGVTRVKKMDQNAKQQIIAELEKRGATAPCPRCGNSNFILMDGFLNNPLQTELTGSLILGGPTVPSIVTVCSKCGFMSQHALGALQLLQSDGGAKK